MTPDTESAAANRKAQMSAPSPTLAVVILTLNEEKFIGAVINKLLTGDYPQDRLEILVVDGMSTDATRDIVGGFCAQHPQVKLLDNPGALKPRGLNLAIRETSADVVMWLSAHADYPAGYPSTLVEQLYALDADNVGGTIRSVSRGEGLVAQSLANVLTHPFGMGNARHWTGADTPQEGDIVFAFCVRRTLFDEVGLFDERLRRGQDREFSLRLSKLGKRMMILPQVQCTYYARDTIGAFVSWAFDCGATPITISRITGSNLLSIRNFIPAAFVLWLVVFGIGAVFSTVSLLLFCAGLLAYVIAAFAAAAVMAIKGRSPALLLTMPVTFFLWHTTYGLGFLREFVFRRRPKGGAAPA